MDKESVFSAEYEIKNTTDSKLSIQKKSSKTEDKKENEIIDRIESDYKLSKPRRKLISAKII